MNKRYKLDPTTGMIMVDEKGNPIVEVLDDDGKVKDEYGVDAIHLLDKIPDLNKEAKDQREAKEKLEKQLKEFADIDDPAAAKAALEKLADLEKNGKLNTENIDKIKADLLKVEQEKYDKMVREFQEMIAEKDTTISSQQEDIFDSLVTTKFDNSPYFTGKEPKTLLPAAVAKSYWKGNFKVEKNDRTGKNDVVPYDQNGEVILSRQRPGEVADFNEAMGILIDKSEEGFKSRILPPSGGSGAPGGGGNGSGYNQQLKDMPADQRLTALRKGQGSAA